MLNWFDINILVYAYLLTPISLHLSTTPISLNLFLYIFIFCVIITHWTFLVTILLLVFIILIYGMYSLFPKSWFPQLVKLNARRLRNTWLYRNRLHNNRLRKSRFGESTCTRSTARNTNHRNKSKPNDLYSLVSPSGPLIFAPGLHARGRGFTAPSVSGTNHIRAYKCSRIRIKWCIENALRWPSGAYQSVYRRATAVLRITFKMATHLMLRHSHIRCIIKYNEMTYRGFIP